MGQIPIERGSGDAGALVAASFDVNAAASSAARAAISTSASATTTCAPFRASKSAVSRPMPLAPPTTMTILRLKSASAGMR